MAKAPDSPFVKIYDALLRPFKGLYSALHPSAVPPGAYVEFQNLRQGPGTIMSRGGTIKYLDPPVAGATIIDWWQGELQGVSYIVAGFSVSGEVRLYQSSQGSPWSEITETGGYFGSNTGDSRFPSVTGRLSFAACQSPQDVLGLEVLPQRDLLIIGDGTNSNLVWDIGGGANLQLSVHKPIVSPSNASLFASIAYFSQFWQVAGSTGKTYFGGASSSVIALTGSGTWEVPADWNSAANTIDCIGAGQSGALNVGGHGGAFARKNNVTLTPGDMIGYVCGAGGSTTDTTFNTTTVKAQAGANGGLASGSTGDTKFNGGSSGSGVGGGGGAGPNGAGTTSSFSQGGNGDNNIGGAGGFAQGGIGLPGQAGAEYTLTSGGTVGSGGGGARGAHGGGDGGLYGGGAGGAGGSFTPGVGAAGLIVISYTSASSLVNSADFSLADSNTGKYAGNNAIPVLTWSPSATAGEVAAIEFSTQLNIGKGLILITEDSDSGLISISGVSNNGGAIEITTSGNHNRLTGDLVAINGTTGTMSDFLNGLWYVTKNDATHLTLQNSVYSGSWSGGGTLFSPGWGMQELLLYARIEIGKENVAYGSVTTWTTIYEATSTNPSLQRVIPTALISPDDEPPRVQWFFPADQIDAANLTAYHLRITLLPSVQDPVQTAQIFFLAICGAGEVPGTAEWTLTYSDNFSRAESPGYVAANDQSVSLSQVGGPTAFSSPTQPDFKIPLNPAVWYDYKLITPNPQGGSFIAGGLQGYPTTANYYVRLPGANPPESVAAYFFGTGLYSPAMSGSTNGWHNGAVGASITVLSIIYTSIHGDTSMRNFERFAPNDFQIAIPPAACLLYANNRLLAGNVTDGSGNNHASDLYGSAFGQPFRFQAVVTDDASGFRTIFTHERIEVLGASAASAEGRSQIFVLTNLRFTALGGTGAFEGSSNGSNDLTVIYTLFHRGTNAPRSFCTSPDGAVFWLDNLGQYEKYTGGAPKPISRYTVDDKPQALPAGRVDAVSSVFFNDRMYSAYTPSGSITNDNILGWNDVLSEWEFNDAPPIPAERLLVYYDPTKDGSGQRLLIAAQDGTIYEYDVAGQVDLGSPIPIQFTTGELPAPDTVLALQVRAVYIDSDPVNDEFDIYSVYRVPACEYKTTITLAQGWVEAQCSNAVVVAAPNDQGGERGKAAQLRFIGQIAVNTGIRFFHIDAEIKVLSSREPKGG